ARPWPASRRDSHSPVRTASNGLFRNCIECRGNYLPPKGSLKRRSPASSVVWRLPDGRVSWRSPEDCRFLRTERPQSTPQNASRTLRRSKWTHPAQRNRRSPESEETTMSLQQAITDFRGQFRGTVIEPQDPGYDEARKVYNGMIDRKPRLI